MKRYLLALCGALLLLAPSGSADAGGGYPGCNCGPRVQRSYAPRPVVRHVRPAPTYDGRGHETNWMQRQGFTSCTQVYSSCLRGADKPGHGLAYQGVCENRLATCRRTGTWATTHTGTVHGLRP